MKITTHPCRCLQNQYKYIGGARWGGRNEHALGFLLVRVMSAVPYSTVAQTDGASGEFHSYQFFPTLFIKLQEGLYTTITSTSPSNRP